MDEESKLNVNTVDAAVLEKLFTTSLGFSGEQAAQLALALSDWRTPGESQMTGFYSEEYYKNLEFPYSVKNSEFELLDELLLVQGMNEETLKTLFNHITIYGDGKININTAGKDVLMALGLSGTVADK